MTGSIGYGSQLLQRSHRLQPLSSPRAVLVGSLSVLPVLLWESLGVSWMATLIAIGLALGLGGTVGLLSARIRTHWLLVLVLLAVPLALGHGELSWAIERSADLFPLVGGVAVWFFSLVLALALGLPLYVFMAREGAALGWRFFFASAVAIPALSIGLLKLQPHYSVLGRAMLWLVVSGGLAVSLSGVAARAWSTLAVLGGVAAMALIPGPYERLYGLVFGLTLGLTMLSLRHWTYALRPGNRETTESSTTKERWLGLLMLAGVLLALIVAERSIAMGGLTSGRVSRRGPLTTMVSWLGRSTDVDGDGHGILFGQSDCAPFDPHTHPGAHEVPDNGIDDNCLAGDAAVGSAARVQARLAVNSPPAVWRPGGDVALILVDTLRLDSSRSHFPELWRDTFAFERAYAPSSFTAFSLFGILGARLPTGHELVWSGRLAATPVHPPPGLPSWLQGLGYRTALVGAINEIDSHYFRPVAFGHGLDRRQLTDYETSSEEVTDRALRQWAQLGANSSRFLWVHYMAVHEERERVGYEEVVGRTAEAVMRLIARLGQDTLVIVLADHGQEFGEHGGTDHGQTLFEEVVRVPLFIRVPGRTPRRISETAPLMALTPTLMALIAPEFLPEGEGPYLCLDQHQCAGLDVPMALEMQERHLHALVSGGFKIIRDLRTERLMAYDLELDPGENHPLDPIPGELHRSLISWEEDAMGATDDTHSWPYRRTQ